jgi:hypothetical protein
MDEPFLQIAILLKIAATNAAMKVRAGLLANPNPNIPLLRNTPI